MTAVRFKADCSIKATADKPAKVSILAYSGSPMRLPGIGMTLVDLAGMSLSSIPLLADHTNLLSGIAGTGTPRIESGKLQVEGVLAAGTAAANQIIALHKSGVKLQASIGAEIEASAYIDAGKTIQANGRTHTAPAGGITFVSKSKLREVSFVAAGADSHTSVSIAAKMRNSKMDSAFQNWVQQSIPNADLNDPDVVAGLHANYHGRSEPTPADIAAATTMIQASGVTIDDEELRLRRIERSLQREARIKNLEAKIPMAHTVPASRRHGIGDEKTLTAAFCLLGGIAKPEQHFDERTLDAADRASRGLGLQSFLMTAACQNGYQARPGEYITAGNLRNVLTAAFMPQIQASGWSTADISNVLSNTASKMLLDGFQEMPSEWRSIAAIKSVKNFKEHTFVRLLDSLEFEQIGPAGEIKHGTLADATMTAQASTYAKMLAITRQDIINDDLSALTDVPRRLGRAAAQKFNSLFWTAFVASDGFFAGGNGNIVGTGDERLSSAGLTTGLIAFRAQKSPAADGAKLIGGKPAILLVPPALEITARALINSSAIVTGEDATMPNSNPFQNLATLVVEDRLSTAEGGNDAYWYLLRAPTFAPTMLVPALNGRVEPTVETAEADFSQLGISMRGYSDVGAARGEPLCGLLLDGTSS